MGLLQAILATTHTDGHMLNLFMRLCEKERMWTFSLQEI